MKKEQINIRDPFVLVHEGTYYLYGTRGATCWGPADGFDVYTTHLFDFIRELIAVTDVVITVPSAEGNSDQNA